MEGQPQVTGKRRPSVRLIVFLLLVLMAAAATPSLLRTLLTAPVAAMSADLKATADAVKGVLNIDPEVRIRTQVINHQVSPIAELAMAEREMRVKFNWDQKWLKSTKSIEVSGPFRVKAGFDLEKPVRVIHYPEENSVRIEMPRAEILSVEPFGEIDYTDESGWWNKVRDEDRTNALNALHHEARRFARESDLCAQAEKILTEKLEKLLSENQADVQIIFLDEIVPSPSDLPAQVE